MIELSELRHSAQKAFPADKLRPPRDASWKLVTAMGWLLIELPDQLGGLGLGPDAAATLHFEMGRVLATAPLIPALLGLGGIAASDSLADRDSWIERICGGEYVPLPMLPSKVETRSDGALDGQISGVFEADMASHVLAVLAGRYVLVPVDAAGVMLAERPLWDQSRRIFDLVLDGFHPDPALIVSEGDAAAALHDRLSSTAQLALAADALGGANAALEMTVAYLKIRRQFDRPLAMFQALKHRCADLKVRLCAAEALLWARAANRDAAVTDFGALKALACDVYRMVVEEAVQLHGGIGLTDEHQCHLYLKRALLNQQLCGSIDHWREAAGRAALKTYTSA